MFINRVTTRDMVDYVSLWKPALIKSTSVYYSPIDKPSLNISTNKINLNRLGLLKNPESYLYI